MATESIKTVGKIILRYDLTFSNISVPETGSTNVQYTFPVQNGYIRAMPFIRSVSGSGTGNVVMTIHGTATSGSVFLSSGSGAAITANFVLSCLYVKDDYYENITPT